MYTRLIASSSRLASTPTRRAFGTSRTHFLPQTAPASPYHALFQLDEWPNQFVIDPGQLKLNFLKAQRLAHPDTMAGKGADATTLAGIESAELNKAYQTLRSPLRRAEYLLALRGLKMGEQDKLDGQQDMEHAEFIMEVMEARSALEDAADEEEIEEIRRTNRIRIQSEVQMIEDAFAADDTESAMKATIRLRYWENLEAAAKDLPPQCTPQTMR